MKIGLIGAGRLGLAFALLCEEAGYEVIASDVRKGYISNLQKGVLSTTEPDVDKLLDAATNIEFTTDNKKVIKECDIIFTLVATPSLSTGDYNSVIGMNRDNSLKKFLKDSSAKRHFPALGEATISGLLVTADEETGLAKKVQPIILGGALQKRA